MRKWGAWLVVIAALGGGMLSTISLRQFLAITQGSLTAPSFCNISEGINCDVVSASSFAAIAGVPVAGIGLLFFVAQLILGLWEARGRASLRATASVGLLLSLTGLCISFFYLYVMIARLETLCLTCLAMDVTVLTILIGWLATGAASFRIGRLRKQFVRPVVAVAGVYGIGLLFLVNLVAAGGAGRQMSEQVVEDAVRMHMRQAPQSIDLDLDAHPSWGADDAKVIIIEFSDFACPFCRVAAFGLQPRLAEFRNDVRFVFVNYPLDPSCNDKLKRNFHENACLAARAALCAQIQGKFWEYHDQIFRNQEHLSRKVLLKLAKDEGMAPDAFAACLDDPATDQWVRRDIALANAADVQGTPTLLINGRLFTGWQRQELLRAVLRAEIAQQSQK